MFLVLAVPPFCPSPPPRNLYHAVMEIREDVREFLASRRARITPDRAGLPAYGGNRRVPGLRREEVALLAGVSVDYYIRLERGNLAGASDSVLTAIAAALQLDDAEREHLFDLARRSTGTTQPRHRTSPPRIRPVVQQVLDAITAAPAWVRNARHDLLAANQLARALYAPLLADPRRPANNARFVFLDPASRDFFADWNRAADDIAAMLRSEAGRNPHDKALTDLIGELTTRSPEFTRRWAAHDVRFHRTGRKHLHHPVVGDLLLNFEAMSLASDPELTILVYTADPDSATADALQLLASWAATQESPPLESVNAGDGAVRDGDSRPDRRKTHTGRSPRA